MGELVIAVDCSGSITQQVLNAFAAEITAICNELLPSTTHVIYFDSDVSHHDQYDRYEEPEIIPHGGGGTAFRPVFEYIRDNDINPEVTVFLTDLWCWDFGPEPEEYPTIFVSTEKNYRKPDFGTVVVME
jgi:predicted metal-dependent peptidase